jgi:transposase
MDMDARDQRMKRLHEEGRSASEIAAVLGLSARTVLRRLGRVGVVFSRRHVDERERQRIAELYLAGNSQSEVARLLGWAKVTIRLHLDRAGIERRPPRCSQPPRECELARCKTTFVPEADKVRRGAGRFCSYPCWNEWRTGKPQREWRHRPDASS